MAGVPKNYYKKKLQKYSYSETGKGYQLHFELGDIGAKLDAAQDALDAQVWQDVQKYMPVETGELKNRTNMLNTVERTRGKVFLYPPDSKYGHYQYEGIVYVDPVYGKAAFYSEDYGFWSRPGVEKIPSDRKLTYSQPNAVPHWGEEAILNHLPEWYKLVKKVITE